MSESPELSVVIPVYNEIGRLEPGLRTVLEYLAARPFTTELVIVDDGSTDGTADLARSLVPTQAGRIIAEPHRGKGGAVRAGMLAARGRHALFLDIDLATPLEFIEPCLEVLRERADVVIGSRRVPNASIEQPQGMMRETLGRGFSALSRAVTGVPVRDFTCGFKGFRADAARKIFSRQRIDNWSFDTEILFLAHRLGCRLYQLPVRWRDDRRSKVRLGQDIVGSLAGLLRIRVNHLRGEYRLGR